MKGTKGEGGARGRHVEGKGGDVWRMSHRQVGAMTPGKRSMSCSPKRNATLCQRENLNWKTFLTVIIQYTGGWGGGGEERGEGLSLITGGKIQHYTIAKTKSETPGKFETVTALRGTRERRRKHSSSAVCIIILLLYTKK